MEELVLSGNKKYFGVRQKILNGTLLIILSNDRFLACSYIDVKTANKLKQKAAIVTGVKTFDDMLDAQIVAQTDYCDGDFIGKTGLEFLQS